LEEALEVEADSSERLRTAAQHSIKITYVFRNEERTLVTTDLLYELSEQGLLAASEYQRQNIDAGDRDAFARFVHPNFLINAPNNRCAGREQVLRLFDAGTLAHESCERQVEGVELTGTVGVVMGNEMVTPFEGSPLEALFGKGPHRRRFTDVYLFENGRWIHLARQASLVRES
jgi:hypothetical protein